MHNDLKQLREGAEMILNTALEENGVIDDFVFVPFHDPAVGPATVTRDKEVFKAALDLVNVHGGGDCPERSLTGIQLALNVSKPRSYVYVFTDATAKDHSMVGKLLDAVQRKQTQVVFVLTGHCNDLDRPHYKVYQQIAAASSGQVFNLNKTSVHKVLEFVRSSLAGRTVNLGSAVNPPGFNTQGIPIDSNLGEVTVSVSGSKPSIKVVNPSGTEVTGPPQLVTTLDLSEIMVVKVLQPEPGNWTITTGSEVDHSVKVVGVSNLAFNHGFSVGKPTTLAQTSYRPLQGAYNYMLISLTQANCPVEINYAEILFLNGTLLFEVPLKLIDSKTKIYLADAFVPPDDMFYIAVEVKAHQSVTLDCDIESLVPVTAVWTKDNVRLQPQISSLQSSSIQYVINDMTEEKAGTYTCVVKNIAGVNQAATEVTLLVDPPQVIITPENRTVEIGESITISCSVISDALLLKYQLIFNGSLNEHEIDIHLDPSIDGLYSFNKTITNTSERDNGIYSCVAANRGGQTIQSTHLTIKTKPSVQILGPHTLTKLKNSDIQLFCHVENARRLLWVAPNGTVVKDIEVLANVNDMFDVNVIEEGVWSCVGIRGTYNDTDSVYITVVIKPEVSIEGARNISIINGTQLEIICNVLAKPLPRILWHRETEDFLNNTITILKPNVYRSVLTIDSAKENVKGTYFCFGENSEGIHQDSVTVSVRRKMQLIEGFQDSNVQLYAQIALPCHIDSYPPPTIKWYHNGTRLQVNENLYLSENNNTLYILKVGFEDLGSFACEADNGYEKINVEGSLNVEGLESPLLSKEPVQRLTQEGKSTILTCRILKGNPIPSITWQHRDVTKSLYTDLPDGVIANQDKTELIITKVERKHWGIYRCIAENVIGKDVYDVALVVQYPPKLKSKSPTDELLSEGGNKVTLSCEASGIPPPLVTWRKDNHPVGYSKNVYLTDASDLVIENATVDDSGLFTCNATSVLGYSQRNVTLTVYAPPKITPPAVNPEIEVLEGDLVELPCIAQGVPTPRVKWLQNGETVTSGRKRIDEFGLRFVANLTDFGEYTCVATNQYGNTSFKYSVLIWVSPTIQSPLVATKEVLLGANTSLECNVVGFPIPTVYWEVNGRLLERNTTDLSFDEYGNLNISNIKTDRAGLYTCIAENVAGIAKKSTYVKVNEAPKIIHNDFEGPYIATTDDTHLVISCRASGVPKPYVVWSKDHKYIDKDSRYNVDVDGTLTIEVLSEDLSGQYTCIAKNSIGTDTKTVTVDIYSALTNRMQADESQNIKSTLEGTNATFECPIRSIDTDTVKWYKDAQLISTANQLQIQNITRQNACTYACVVTNAIGSSYSNVTVNVEWPPKFIDKKVDAEVIRGDDWYFDCGTDAKPQAKTKWLFNSKPLIGEDKDRLVLLNIQPRNAGVYKCVASNEHGTITEQFKLDVAVPPFISKFELLDVQLKEGTNATLECNANGTPAPNITWKYNNTNLYLQNSSLILHNITANSEGIYCCIAENKAGNARLAYRVTVTAPATIQEIVLYKSGMGETVLGVVEAMLNTNIRLSCKASGLPAPTIQWLLGGNIIGQNAEEIGYADLILSSIDVSDTGEYTCAVSNDGGMDERTIKVDVLEPPQILNDLLSDSNKSENFTKLEVILGQPFYLHCHPYGNPMPEVYWFKDDFPLRLFDNTMVSTDYGEVLASKRSTVDQTGNYTCVARNKVGNASYVFLVYVLEPPPAPKENSIPVITRVGKPLRLTCPLEGYPLPIVTWVKHPYTEISVAYLYDDNFTMVINKTEVSDSGKYICVMTNKVGTTEYAFDVTIEKPPSIAGNVGINNSEYHVVPLHRSVVLKCQVDGNPPPKISWLKDTQPLSDNSPNIHRVLGNSLLAIWSVKTRDAGQYICVAQNSVYTAHRRYYVQVQVPGKWSDWSERSFCNVTCGVGYQHRTRYCHYIDDNDVIYGKTTKPDKIIIDETGCKGFPIEQRKCHMPPCEDGSQKWFAWSKWSPCSSSCGAGTQARTRRCKVKGKCDGDNVQIRKCPDLPKCSTDSQQSSSTSANEVFSSKEGTLDNAESYIPVATFEMIPEFELHQTDVDEIHTIPEEKLTGPSYDVNVTENLDGSYRGLCDPGFKQDNLTGSCDDIDECLIDKNECHSTQSCVNTAGGYMCACDNGFMSLGIGQRCLDVNECVLGTDGCEYACVNTAGGYVCACPKHMRLHTDKHHCYIPSSNHKISHEELNSEEYLSATIDSPAKYLKNRN
ncbi:hypothetical protein O0L34_g9197 [Tuta absoluta]|nr:hypothetical protein O0L34_g9197 [Tuta absoluta]